MKNGKIWIIVSFLYRDGDPNHSQNFMGSELDQDLSFDYFYEVPKYLRNHGNKLIDKLTNSHENNDSLAEVEVSTCGKEQMQKRL